MSNKTLNREAVGGSIHPISEILFTPGEPFGDVLVTPGFERQWEPATCEADHKSWFRRDGTPLNPTHFSPLPGQRINLK